MLTNTMSLRDAPTFAALNLLTTEKNVVMILSLLYPSAPVPSAGMAIEVFLLPLALSMQFSTKAAISCRKNIIYKFQILM